MNRPSRSDDTTEHPTWNQNPPFLAADLTTCEDLNGMANVREHRRAGANDMNGQNGAAVLEYAPVQLAEPPTPKGRNDHQHRGQTSVQVCPPSKEATTMAMMQHPLPVSSESPIRRRSKAVLSWATWIFSVLATSALLNYLNFSNVVSLFGSPGMVVDSYHGFSPHTDNQPMATFVTYPSEPGPASRSIIKRSTCGTGQPISEDDYNTPLHVGALIIILGVSSLACAFSMIMRKIPRVKIPANFFFVIRHFGTGVLIATAFVHLLPTAFTYLGDPCLSGFWTEKYPAMPGAIALAGIFFVSIIEMVFSPHRHIHSPAATRALVRQPTMRMDESAVVDSDIEMEEPHPAPQPTSRLRAGTSSGPIRDMGPLRGRSLSISRQLSQIERPNPDALRQQTSAGKPDVDVEVGAGRKIPLSPEQQHKKDILQCMLLEMGILFHSVFIGMALSVSIGKEFVILLVAIVFHQSFEGLALGARIASIDWPEGSWQPWMMALAYGCTTPVGQAIGLGLHTLYDPESELGLVLVGTMNAISSGLLVFASLVELLSEDFLSDESWKVLRGKRRVVACLIVFAGAFGMSLVGAWA